MTQNEIETRKWKQSRQVGERVFISGRLVLESPTHLGNGDASGVTDIGLLRDELTGRPLLTGASLTGALRSYMREAELGYGVKEAAQGKYIVEQLFGYVGEDVVDKDKDNKATASMESWLLIDDAVGEYPKSRPVEIRDGVAIDNATRTAVDRKKYDIELLAAGTVFPIHLELWLPQDAELAQRMKRWLALALNGLEQGHIHLGMRKRRGFGRCRVTGWKVTSFVMNKVTDVVGWLNYQIPDAVAAEGFEENIVNLLGVGLPETDAREAFHMEATFSLASSLLIRADSGEADAPDMVHLTNAAGQPVVSGTSLAGSIRARAERIARTLKGDAAKSLIDSMFGWHDEKKPDKASGSRVIVQESVVQNPIMDRVQNRVKIDRFTGGAYPQALFSQQPLFARDASKPTTVKIKLTLRKHAEMDTTQFKAEVGLLLLVLKDLWTGDLPIGGERSVGRGRLAGQKAVLTVDGRTCTIRQNPDDGGLLFPDGGAETLESYVEALRDLEVTK